MDPAQFGFQDLAQGTARHRVGEDDPAWNLVAADLAPAMGDHPGLVEIDARPSLHTAISVSPIRGSGTPITAASAMAGC